MSFRIGMMIDKLDYIWKRSTATNCLLAIDQALVSLNNIHDALDKEVQSKVCYNDIHYYSCSLLFRI